MWTPVTHRPKRGPLETQIKKNLKKKRIPRAKVEVKAKLNVTTVEKSKNKEPDPSFHRFQNLLAELQLEVWRHAAGSWLHGMISREDGMYTEKNTRRRTAAHDIGILPHNKCSLFSVSSTTRSVVFEVLRRYDELVEGWKHPDAKWFEGGRWKAGRVWMVDVKDLKNRKSGCEIVDFGPLRRSGRNVRKRIDYKGMMDNDKAEDEKDRDKKLNGKKTRKK